MSHTNLFEKIAKENNTTEENVKSEILFAIHCARMKSPELWENIHGTLEEQIIQLASLTLALA